MFIILTLYRRLTNARYQPFAGLPAGLAVFRRPVDYACVSFYLVTPMLFALMMSSVPAVAAAFA